MKKLLLSFAVIGLFATTQAQDAAKKSGKQGTETPEQKADQQTKKAITQLGLSADQQTKFKAFELERINTVSPLKEKAHATTDKAQKQAIHAQIKTAREKFFNDVNGILTADQQVKWANHKKQMDAKEAENANHHE